MSFISRIEPEPDNRDPLQIILEELRNLHEIAQILSLRLRRLEQQQPGDRPQTRPEAQKMPPPSGHGYDSSV